MAELALFPTFQYHKNIGVNGLEIQSMNSEMTEKDYEQALNILCCYRLKSGSKMSNSGYLRINQNQRLVQWLCLHTNTKWKRREISIQTSPNILRRNSIIWGSIKFSLTYIFLFLAVWAAQRPALSQTHTVTLSFFCNVSTQLNNVQQLDQQF